MELGCPDKPCRCPDCNETTIRTPVSNDQEITSKDVNNYSISSGYRKPSPEDYITGQKDEVMSTDNSGDNIKKEPEATRILQSGYNKKEIVKAEPVREIVATSCVSPQKKEDNSGFYIAGISFLLLLLIGHKKEDKNNLNRD